MSHATSPSTVVPVTFRVEGDRVRGELLLPPTPHAVSGSVGRPPVIVMAHGFAGTRRLRLPAFAERFVAAGYAVLVFDYRGFGDSEGQPRHLVDGPRHLTDWLAAIEHVRTCEQIDPERIVLWGTSFSGGHVLLAAARRSDVRAVIAQVPHVDGLASARLFPARYLPRALWLATQDLLASARGRAPVLAPVVRQDGGFACLAGADAYAGCMALVEEGTPLVEAVPARILLTIARYRPITEVHRIAAPVLLVVATEDALIPAAAVRRAARRIPRCELVELPIGHFEPYQGAWFEKNVAAQLAFLGRHVPVGPSEHARS